MMAGGLSEGQLGDLVATSVDDNRGATFADIFLGLTKTAGELALQDRFADRTPPVNRNASRTDTASNEIAQNQRDAAKEFFSQPQNLVLAGVGILALVIVGAVIAKKVL